MHTHDLHKNLAGVSQVGICTQLPCEAFKLRKRILTMPDFPRIVVTESELNSCELVFVIYHDLSLLPANWRKRKAVIYLTQEQADGDTDNLLNSSEPDSRILRDIEDQFIRMHEQGVWLLPSSVYADMLYRQNKQYINEDMLK